MLATRNKTKKIRKPVDWPNESIHGLLLLAGASILAEPSESCRCHRIGRSDTGSGGERRKGRSATRFDHPHCRSYAHDAESGHPRCM